MTDGKSEARKNEVIHRQLLGAMVGSCLMMSITAFSVTNNSLWIVFWLFLWIAEGSFWIVPFSDCSKKEGLNRDLRHVHTTQTLKLHTDMDVFEDVFLCVLYFEAFGNPCKLFSQFGLFDFAGGVAGDIVENNFSRSFVSRQGFTERVDLFFCQFTAHLYLNDRRCNPRGGYWAVR